MESGRPLSLTELGRRRRLSQQRRARPTRLLGPLRPPAGALPGLPAHSGVLGQSEGDVFRPSAAAVARDSKQEAQLSLGLGVGVKKTRDSAETPSLPPGALGAGAPSPRVCLARPSPSSRGVWSSASSSLSTAVSPEPWPSTPM